MTPVQAFFLLFSMFTVILFISVSSVSAQEGCYYLYGNWSTCQEGNQQRSVECMCGTQQTDISNCVARHLRLQPTSRDCSADVEGEEEEEDEGEEVLPSCDWKWTRWSRCTAPCGGGNTTRRQVCICEDREGPAPADLCNAVEYGNETAECNQYKCGSVPAFNKVYWMNKIPDWPIDPQTRFNCSLGFDVNSTDTPKGKTYAHVLDDSHPEVHPHLEWYYLAKEWIAATLNLANGVVFPPEGLRLIDEVGRQLENCNDWPVDPNTKYVVYYGSKEKLGRLNNNIGGLSNVDAQMAILAAEEGGNAVTGESEGSQRDSAIALFILIPLVVIIAVVIGLTVYYVKQKNTVVEQAAFESDDEASADDVNPHLIAGSGATTITTVNTGDITVPLEASQAGGGVVIERPNHSDDSEEHQ